MLKRENHQFQVSALLTDTMLRKCFIKSTPQWMCQYFGEFRPQIRTPSPGSRWRVAVPSSSVRGRFMPQSLSLPPPVFKVTPSPRRIPRKSRSRRRKEKSRKGDFSFSQKAIIFLPASPELYVRRHSSCFSFRYTEAPRRFQQRRRS